MGGGGGRNKAAIYTRPGTGIVLRLPRKKFIYKFKNEDLKPLKRLQFIKRKPDIKSTGHIMRRSGCRIVDGTFEAMHIKIHRV